MSNSMDELLRRNEAVAKQQADKRAAEEQEQARIAAIQKRGHLAFQHVLDRVKATVDEFNSRSTAGKIGTSNSQLGTWQFVMPNTGKTLTLSGKIDPNLKKIKGKLCGIMAMLAINGGQGIHFLLLEDEETNDKNEWVAVRVRHNPGIQRPRNSPPEPFITSLDEIVRGTTAMHVIVPEYSNDLDSAVREMIGYGLSS